MNFWKQNKLFYEIAAWNSKAKCRMTVIPGGKTRNRELKFSDPTVRKMLLNRGVRAWRGIMGNQGSDLNKMAATVWCAFCYLPWLPMMPHQAWTPCKLWNSTLQRLKLFITVTIEKFHCSQPNNAIIAASRPSVACLFFFYCNEKKTNKQTTWTLQLGKAQMKFETLKAIVKVYQLARSQWLASCQANIFCKDMTKFLPHREIWSMNSANSML